MNHIYTQQIIVHTKCTWKGLTLYISTHNSKHPPSRFWLSGSIQTLISNGTSCWTLHINLDDPIWTSATWIRPPLPMNVCMMSPNFQSVLFLVSLLTYSRSPTPTVRSLSWRKIQSWAMFSFSQRCLKCQTTDWVYCFLCWSCTFESSSSTVLL